MGEKLSRQKRNQPQIGSFKEAYIYKQFNSISLKSGSHDLIQQGKWTNFCNEWKGKFFQNEQQHDDGL